jgi:hypothetical protein
MTGMKSYSGSDLDRRVEVSSIYHGVSVKIIMFRQPSKQERLLDSDTLRKPHIVSDGPSIREYLFRKNSWKVSVSFC